MRAFEKAIAPFSPPFSTHLLRLLRGLEPQRGVRVPRDAHQSDGNACDVDGLDGSSEEQEIREQQRARLEVTEDVVGHGRGLSDDHVYADVDAEGEGARRGDHGADLGGEGGVVEDGVGRGFGDVGVEEGNGGDDEECGERGGVHLQLKGGRVEGLLERAAPDLVECGAEDVCDGEDGAAGVEAEVGRAGDGDADDDEGEGEPQRAVERLAEDEEFDGDDGDDGHVFHDLVEADGVCLQGEVGEDDEAHAGGGELCSGEGVERLDFEEADAGEEEEAEGGEEEVEKGEGGGEVEVVGVHEELVGVDDGDGGEIVEQHRGGGRPLDRFEERLDAGH
mmetsp:Transcript_24903/g.65370  ORF Transcript_24903/g.65370 Transcript_24903/m.65370 type:complete len:335 (-) Transcript_24903:117-1121(-)